MRSEALRIENTTDRIKGMDFNTLLVELVVPVTVINSSTQRFFLPVRCLLDQPFFFLFLFFTSQIRDLFHYDINVVFQL